MTLLDEIRSRGHFVIVVRPTVFLEDRVGRADLEPILSRASVHLRGWDLPHIDPKAPIHHGQGYITQESAWSSYREVWRFHRSGQLAMVRSFAGDWREDVPRWSSTDPTIPVPRELGVIETLYALTEVFELAARLAFTPGGDDRMRVDVSFRGMKDRELVIDDSARAPFVAPYIYADDRYEAGWDIDRVVLAAEAWDLAADAAAEMFASFGWTTNAGVFKDAQTRLRGAARRRN